MLWRRKDSRSPSYTWLLKDWKNLPKAEKIIWIPKLSRSLYVLRAWMPGSLQSQEIPDHTDCYWQRRPVTALPFSLVKPAARVLCCSQLARLWAFCLPALISEATRLIHGTITSDCLVITVRCIKSNLLIKCLCNKVCIDFREAIKSVRAYLKYKKKKTDWLFLQRAILTWLPLPCAFLDKLVQIDYHPQRTPGAVIILGASFGVCASELTTETLPWGQAEDVVSSQLPRNQRMRGAPNPPGESRGRGPAAPATQGADPGYPALDSR